MVTCTVPWQYPDIVELPAAKPWGTTSPRAMSAAKRAISHGPHRTREAPVDDDDDERFGTACRDRGHRVPHFCVSPAVARQ